MDSSVIERPLSLRRPTIRRWVGLALVAAAFSYVWLLPLLRSRGDLLWGHYRLKDILLGIPIGLVTLSIIVVLLSPARYRRPIALRVTTLCFMVVTMIFVCDIGYALVVQGAWRSNFWLDQAHIQRTYSAADSELGFVRKPRVSWRGYVPDADRFVDYQTDENGFRNPPGEHRADIVFIGDSFTEAAQVVPDDTFVRRVGAGSGLSVVNLGRGAYGPQQELIVLQKYGLAYHPRVVIWQLFEGNDLRDAAIFAEWKKDPQQGATSLKERYFSNSLIAEWLSATRAPRADVVTVKLQYRDGTAKRVALRYNYDPEDPAETPSGLAETTRAIEAGYRLCQSQGIQLVIVFLPTMVHVMEPDVTFDRVEDQVRYLPKGIGNEKGDFRGRMAEFCGQMNCPFIDTLPAFRHAAETDDRNLYIPNDEHLDIRGHEVISQTLLEWLRSQGIVSQKPK